MAHTKGPWEVNPYRAQVDCGVPSAKGGLLPIAQMLWPTDERTEAETAANARLIAAAPQLLEALHNAVMLWAWSSTDAVQQQWLSDARAAIAAARQESAS